MKKLIIGTLASGLLGVGAYFNFTMGKIETQLSELTLANIEALASEIPDMDGGGEYDTVEKTYKSQGDQTVVVCVCSGVGRLSCC